MSSIAIKKYSVLINCDKKYYHVVIIFDLFSHVLCIASKILILSLMPSGLLDSRRYHTCHTCIYIYKNHIHEVAYCERTTFGRVFYFALLAECGFR